MGLTTDEFRDFMTADPEDGGTVPFSDALGEVAVDMEVDSVAAVREMRRRL